MLKFLCTFVLCSCVLTSADTCDSKLQQVCGNEIKEGKQACYQCGRQHESDLEAAGCTVAEVEQLCDGSTDTCDSKLQQVCGNEIKEGKQACERCGRQHESVLKAAGCTVAEVEKICQGQPPRPKGGNDLKKVLLDNSNEKTAIGGRCLDGSPAGYYYGAPSGNGIHKWSIYLKGGGACYTEESCKQRAVMKNGLGSSVFWTDGEFDSDFTSNSSEVNPDFFDGHRVFVPYCTGDVHSGTRTSATAETWGLWFDGHLNFKRIIDDLKSKYGFSDAKQVLLGGGSAGGYGTFFNADYLSSEVPNATVKAAPQAGWFVPGDPNAVPAIAGSPLNYTAKEVTHTNQLPQNPAHALWQQYAHPSCAKDIGAEYCGTVHNLYKYIETPLLVVENQYDTNQIFDTIGFCPRRSSDNSKKVDDYIAYYGSMMRNSIEPQVKGHGQNKTKGKDGLFFPSCLAHGISASTTLHTVSNYMDLIGDWFFQRGKYPSHVLVDNCTMTDGLPCNPTCKNK